MAQVDTWHFDPATGKLYRAYTEDVEPLLDSLAEQRNHGDPGAYRKSKARWRKVGEIPLIILDQWFREGFNALDPANAEEVKRRLSGPYKKFLAVDKI